MVAFQDVIDLPFRMWLYPLPALVALLGWIFLFVTSGAQPMLYSALALATGVIAFLFSDEARDISGAALPVYGRA